METLLDKAIPFMPAAITIYLGCFLFWAASYWFCSAQGKDLACRFFLADYLAKGICLFFFVAFPTTNTRPLLGGANFWERAVILLYHIDAPDNLFPSIHCLVSWLCYIGVRKRKTIPSWCRRLSLFSAIAVFLSTLALKQHTIADVFAGIVVAEISYAIAGKCCMNRFCKMIFKSMWLRFSL